MSTHLDLGTVVRTHETRVSHPVYFDGPLPVYGLGHRRNKARRRILDVVLTGRIKFTRLATRRGTAGEVWYSFREVDGGGQGRTVYFREDARVLRGAAAGSVADLFSAAVSLADRTA